MVSKKASTKEGRLPEIAKGRDPKKEASNQPIATIAKASLAFIFL
jgi:hypothetical protein